jgi:hypothetical protein
MCGRCIESVFADMYRYTGTVEMDSMEEKKKKKKRRRNKLDVEYKEDYSANIVRGWMLGKPVVGEAVFDDRNEDVFEPRPSRYVHLTPLL